MEQSLQKRAGDLPEAGRAEILKMNTKHNSIHLGLVSFFPPRIEQCECGIWNRGIIEITFILNTRAINCQIKAITPQRKSVSLKVLSAADAAGAPANVIMDIIKHVESTALLRQNASTHRLVITFIIMQGFLGLAHNSKCFIPPNGIIYITLSGFQVIY